MHDVFQEIRDYEASRRTVIAMTREGRTRINADVVSERSGVARELVEESLAEMATQGELVPRFLICAPSSHRAVMSVETLAEVPYAQILQDEEGRSFMVSPRHVDLAYEATLSLRVLADRLAVA